RRRKPRPRGLSADLGDVLDVEAGCTAAVPVIDTETAGEMQRMLALGKQHLSQIAAERPEGDRLDARPISACERCADMVAAGPVGENHAMSGEREERRRIAGTIRSGLVEKLDQIEIGAP